MSAAPKLAPKPSVHIGGGDPAGFPGYRPLNPWGRPMPKPARRPELPSHQLFVETRDKRIIPIGPRGCEDFLKPMLWEIEAAIAAGTEKDWRNPHIVKLLRSR